MFGNQINTDYFNSFLKKHGNYEGEYRRINRYY